VAELGNTLAFEWLLDIETQPNHSRFHLSQIDPFYLAERRSEARTRISAEVNRSLVGSNRQASSGTSNPAEVPKKLLTGLAAGRGRAIATAKVWTNPVKVPINISSGSILVLPFVTPDWLPLIKRSAGIITEQGGMTSHGAILARELGIPAIVGATQATQLIRNGDRILIDSEQGNVYRLELPLPGSLSEVTEQETGDQTPVAREITSYHIPIDFTPPTPDQPITGTKLLANLSQLESLELAATLPLDGVGLLRAELMAIDVLDQQHPALWIKRGRQADLVDRLANTIHQFAQAFFPRPVFYRSFDLRSHEFQGLEGGDALPVETNPMLGMRGTLSYQYHPQLFELELLALARIHQQGNYNVHLLLPFVRTVEEFIFCRHRVEQAGLLQSQHFQLWLMAEVPSVLLLLPGYIKAGAQGISIGSNDLTQLLLGIDRDQPQMAQGFDERHPVVMRAIAHLIHTARQHHIPCSICGQAPAQYPELIDYLVRWGISSISVDLDAVERTHREIARAEQRLLLERNYTPTPEEPG
jgi:pyruvate, water dikinase